LPPALLPLALTAGEASGGFCSSVGWSPFIVLVYRTFVMNSALFLLSAND
jgi:hypothetical protein